LNIELNNSIFSEEELRRLCSLFSIDVKDEQSFQNAIEKITHAAIMEYKEMFLGRGLPTRADEIRQHRLLYLIKFYFQGRIPNEVEVASMFQLTETESRSLIKSVKTRFRFELLQEIRQTLRTIIESASRERETEPFRVVIQSDNVLEELNQIISIQAPYAVPISKCRSTTRTYEITEDSYDILCRYLEIQTNAQQEPRNAG